MTINPKNVIPFDRGLPEQRIIHSIETLQFQYLPYGVLRPVFSCPREVLPFRAGLSFLRVKRVSFLCGTFSLFLACTPALR